MPEENESYSHKERLHSPNQFKSVFNKAKKFRSETFTMLFRKNECDYPRLGIIVAKRKAKRAVDRNLIKRIIRESFRLNKSKIPANDYIVLLSKPIDDVSRNNFREQLNTLWNEVATA